MLELAKPKEDHLEAILILGGREAGVRRVDVANFLGKSKATVTVTIDLLMKNGFVKQTPEALLLLTDAGLRVAEPLYERRCFFRDWLVQMGIDWNTADREAQDLKSAISAETFERIKGSACYAEADAV